MPFEPETNKYLKIQFVPRSKHSSLHYKTRRLALFVEMPTVNCEKHTKYINKLCDQEFWEYSVWCV